MVQIPQEITDIFKILNMTVKSEQDLFKVLIARDLLLRVDIEQQLTELINTLKGKYKTSKLNCLHKNRESKQKFPGINLVRQILRCNGYHLKPVVNCRGYCKHSGKKIVDRNFKIIRLNNYKEIKEKSLNTDELEISGLGFTDNFNNKNTINKTSEIDDYNFLQANELLDKKSLDEKKYDLNDLDVNEINFTTLLNNCQNQIALDINTNTSINSNIENNKVTSYDIVDLNF